VTPPISTREQLVAATHHSLIDYSLTTFFVSPNTIWVWLGEGSESTVEAKRVLVTFGSEDDPFPRHTVKIEGNQIVSSTATHSLRKISED
jgi:hypothetical protein